MNQTTHANSFENLRHEGNRPYWLASQLSRLLNYPSFIVFQKAIHRAEDAISRINLIREDHIINIVGTTDYKLSRFACYLIACEQNQILTLAERPEIISHLFRMAQTME